MPNESTFSERLKEIRKRRGFTQGYVAEQLGVTRPAYTAYESGKREPDFSALSKLAKIYGVSTDYLLGIEIPSWASEKDIVDLLEMLNQNVTMAYGGENLTVEEKQRVKDIITGLFWEKAHKRKEGGDNDRAN